LFCPGQSPYASKDVLRCLAGRFDVLAPLIAVGAQGTEIGKDGSAALTFRVDVVDVQGDRTIGVIRARVASRRAAKLAGIAVTLQYLVAEFGGDAAHHGLAFDGFEKILAGLQRGQITMCSDLHSLFVPEFADTPRIGDNPAHLMDLPASDDPSDVCDEEFANLLPRAFLLDFFDLAVRFAHFVAPLGSDTTSRPDCLGFRTAIVAERANRPIQVFGRRSYPVRNSG